MQSILLAQNLVANTNRGPSDALWDTCPVVDIVENPSKGMIFFDDFLMVGGTPAAASVSVGLGAWAAYAEAGAAIQADPQQEGGVIGLGGSASVGLTMSSQAGAFRIVSPATGFPMQQEVWLECRVAVDNSTTGLTVATAKRDFFVGLAGNDSVQLNSAANTVISAGNNVLAATCSLLGFHFRGSTNANDVGFTYAATGQTIQYPTGMQTLSNTVLGSPLTASVITAAGTTWVPQTGFIKLGFHYQPGTAKTPRAQISTAATTNQTKGNVAQTSLTVYVNGLPCSVFLIPTDIQAATFPSGFMCPVIAWRGGTATAGKAYADWIRVAQRANT